MRSRSVVVLAAAMLLSLVVAAPAAAEPSPAGSQPMPQWLFSSSINLEVLSSDAAAVSGGTARMAVDLPLFTNLGSLRIAVDGRDVTDEFSLTTSQSGGWWASLFRPKHLEGVVTDLPDGDSEITASARRWWSRQSGSLTVSNHPVSGPIFSGPHQTPFKCSTESHRNNAELGPIVDDNCSIDTVVSYKYRTTDGAWADYDPAAPRPADMATTTTIDDQTVDYIVRWERGTINRFIYSIAVLSPDASNAAEPDLSAWNDRLIYYFQGGVGIGHYQGNPSGSRMLYDDGLKLGYAVAYSTGTKTGEHYNLELGGETALMVKEHFVTGYGVPDYTVGVGGSGGGIQQYVYAQNHKGLIDAGIPQYSYPDMVTQTIHVGDCELLERWMDIRLLGGDLRWADWDNREWLEGMNASNEVDNPAYDAMPPGYPEGASECIAAWRGLSPLTLNPNFGTAPGVTADEQVNTEWTHFGDLVNIYGTAADGYASSTWDNVGVQYGLQALRDGNITVDDFLALNAEAGGWKNQPDMVQEGCPILEDLCALVDPTITPPVPGIYPAQVDPWSWRNQTYVPGMTDPAPRTTADPGAIAAAFDSGMVNHGDIQIPMIDWRHYLEDELDMHNSHQSFATRQRMLNYDGDASNQIIWFTDVADGTPEFDQTPMAFEVIDEWMSNIERRPWRGVAGNKPARAVDTCFDANGEVMYAGDDVWGGILDDGPEGACAAELPVYSTSRIVAGAPITGDVFKCALQSVDEALDSGLYGGVTMNDQQIASLKAIFPDGVCDYSQPGVRP